jgi:hypothetical protein
VTVTNVAAVVVPPTVTFSANPASVLTGESSTLTWSSTKATSCVLTASGQNMVVGTSGSVSTGPLASSVTVAIKCSTATASVTVTVNNPPPPQPVTCTTFTYSDWSTCSPGGTQTRTVTSSAPSGCVGGSPLTSQTCTPPPVDPPACTGFNYSDWSTCSASGSQSRTVTSTVPATCSGGATPTVTQSCTPPVVDPPPVTTTPTYYLSPSGSDTAAGSATAPWKTFTKAWSALKAGDTLVVKDGSYVSVSPPSGKSGAVDAPITLKAENDGGATLSQLTIKGSSYLTFVGFEIRDPINAVAVVSAGTGKASHDIKFSKIGFGCTAGASVQNDSACFDFSDGTHHSTLEDSWGWGSGRYTILCYGGPGGSPPNLTCDNNTFRRLVLRQGPTRSSGGNPQASIALYYSGSNLVENVIAVDGSASSDTSNSAFYITGHAPPPNSDSNHYNKVVAFNNLGAGFWLDCSGAVCNNAFLENSVFNASGAEGVVISGGTCTGFVMDHVTSALNKGSGFEGYSCGAATITNSAFVKNTGMGAKQSPYEGSVSTAHHNGFYGNVGGDRQSVPVSGSDVSLQPVEPTSKLSAPWKGLGSSGSDIGANVDVSWVAPFEARIKADICAVNPKGFCLATSLQDYLK